MLSGIAMASKPLNNRGRKSNLRLYVELTQKPLSHDRVYSVIISIICDIVFIKAVHEDHEEPLET